jgi:hypothetical protein
VGIFATAIGCDLNVSAMKVALHNILAMTEHRAKAKEHY